MPNIGFTSKGFVLMAVHVARAGVPANGVNGVSPYLQILGVTPGAHWAAT
ncbi:MAG: hypothetical protein ACOVQN_12030 [Exiguobacterium sp.]